MKALLAFSLIFLLASCKKEEEPTFYQKYEAVYTIGSDAPVTYITQFIIYYEPKDSMGIDLNGNPKVVNYFERKDSIKYDTTYGTGISYAFNSFSNQKYLHHFVKAPGNNRLYISYEKDGKLLKLEVGKYNIDSNATYVESEYTFK